MQLAIKNLNYAYAEENVLNGINLEIDAGTFWCVVGPNGSGKSTLLKLISGLLSTTHLKGEIFWKDRLLSQWPKTDLAKHVGYVPGTLTTLFPVRILDFVAQGRYAHAPFWREQLKSDRLIADEVLKRVGLYQYREALLGTLSSGQLQLALIARTLVQDPDVFILDETISNLDLNFQGQIFEILGELHKIKKTIFVVSHDLNLVAEFCPNAILIKDGNIQSMGTTKNVLTDQAIASLYPGYKEQLIVGENPFTKQPKIFWKSTHKTT